MKILVLNVGSSSLKGGVYEMGEGMLADAAAAPEWSTQAEWPRADGAAHGRVAAALRDLPGLTEIRLVGHRVVHGGPGLRATAWITPEVKAGIAAAAELAPEHNPVELAAIEEMEGLLGPGARQAAVFDTAFHATLAPAAYVYPGPYEWLERGIRRYGFHGINHQYASRRAVEILGMRGGTERIVCCHLGNGCSLAAVRGGVCVDTTMGFTPLEGLMMGSRSGSVDPGILLHLLRRGGATAEALDRTLNEESGLKGISGVSNDLRQVLAAVAEGNARARLAFEIYIHRLRAGIGAMAASLAGMDALVFTGGVGENSDAVREAACAALGYLGVEMDREKNAAGGGDRDIAAAGGKARVVVVHAQENWEIARECRRLARG
ncbi:MAG: acetate/propionate family kinase [Bryobacteraceae bacterium]